MPGIASLLGSLILVTAQVGPDPVLTAAFVGRLGSTKFTEREAASKALVDLGRDALPALSRARKSADPEVQLRAEYLLERIERSLLVRSTHLRLEPGQQRIAEILRQVREQTGFRFEVDPGPDPAWIQSSVRIPEPVPDDFWSQLTALGLSGNWVIDHESPLFGVRIEPSFHIAQRPSNAPIDRTSSGPLCLVLRGYEQDRMARFGGRGAAGRSFPVDPLPQNLTNTCIFKMEVMTEPRIMLRSVGDVRVVEALDASGSNLALEEPAIFIDGPPTTFSIPGAANAVWPFTLTLKRPAGERPRLRSLIIELDADLETRRFEPYELAKKPDDDAQEFPAPAQCGELTIQRARVIKAPMRNSLALELTARTEGWTELAFFRPGNRRRIEMMRAELERVLANLEVADAEGRPIRFDPSFRDRDWFDPMEFRVTLGLSGTGQNGPPALLRYYGNIRDNARFRFEFRDLELPPKH
jgi:hypothetical protein